MDSSSSALWALPGWILGVPLILAIIERMRLPKAAAHTTHLKSQQAQPPRTAAG